MARLALRFDRIAYREVDTQVTRPWARSQYIRTAAALPLEVALVDESSVPLYQRIAERAKHLRELGLSYRVIGKSIGVDHKLVAKAVAWEEARYQRASDRNGKAREVGKLPWDSYFDCPKPKRKVGGLA